MTVREEVLRALEQARGGYVSGETLAQGLGVSRSAVWKAVDALRAAGFAIDSVKNRGYCLRAENDILSPAGVRAHLAQAYRDMPVFVLQRVDSTNNEAKRRLADGASLALILAEEQSAGRGRQGRTFYSPPHEGLYMSLCLPLHASLAEAASITSVAAVATLRAIRALTGETPRIKWVNDLYLGDKKIVGILTEAVADMESGAMQHVVVGIGVNVSTVDFPPELTRAGSLGRALNRAALAAGVTNELLALTADLSDKTYMRDYRENCMVLGRDILYTQQGQTRPGRAVGVADDGSLLVDTPTGQVVLRGGEITLRVAE